MQQQLIILAGATGDLGGRIGHEILKRGGLVRALVRPDTATERTAALEQGGAEVRSVDFSDPDTLRAACRGGSCVVSALSGLRDVIVDLQTRLVDAAVAAGVPRFIPSDFAADFRNTIPGTNRNFDFRRDFREIVDTRDIRVTSILNGMFTDLLIGNAPFVLFPIKRILLFGDPEQEIDLTTIQNTAEYTAAAALDPTTPRWLCIAGETTSANGLARTATAVTGHTFGKLRPGGIPTMNALIRVTRFFVPGKTEIFPPWQGMQYMRDMYNGLAKLPAPDNDRYPDVSWETVAEVLRRR